MSKLSGIVDMADIINISICHINDKLKFLILQIILEKSLFSFISFCT